LKYISVLAIRAQPTIAKTPERNSKLKTKCPSSLPVCGKMAFFSELEKALEEVLVLVAVNDQPEMQVNYSTRSRVSGFPMTRFVARDLIFVREASKILKKPRARYEFYLSWA
jgi:hypothetical protein